MEEMSNNDEGTKGTKEYDRSLYVKNNCQTFAMDNKAKDLNTVEITHLPTLLKNYRNMEMENFQLRGRLDGMRYIEDQLRIGGKRKNSTSEILSELSRKSRRLEEKYLNEELKRKEAEQALEHSQIVLEELKAKLNLHQGYTNTVDEKQVEINDRKKDRNDEVQSTSDNGEELMSRVKDDINHEVSGKVVGDENKKSHVDDKVNNSIGRKEVITLRNALASTQQICDHFRLQYEISRETLAENENDLKAREDYILRQQLDMNRIKSENLRLRQKNRKIYKQLVLMKNEVACYEKQVLKLHETLSEKKASLEQTEEIVSTLRKDIDTKHTLLMETRNGLKRSLEQIKKMKKATTMKTEQTCPRETVGDEGKKSYKVSAESANHNHDPAVSQAAPSTSKQKQEVRNSVHASGRTGIDGSPAVKEEENGEVRRAISKKPISPIVWHWV